MRCVCRRVRRPSLGGRGDSPAHPPSPPVEMPGPAKRRAGHRAFRGCGRPTACGIEDVRVRRTAARASGGTSARRRRRACGCASVRGGTQAAGCGRRLALRRNTRKTPDCDNGEALWACRASSRARFPGGSIASCTMRAEGRTNVAGAEARPSQSGKKGVNRMPSSVSPRRVFAIIAAVCERHRIPFESDGHAAVPTARCPAGVSSEAVLLAHPDRPSKKGIVCGNP